MMSFINAVIDSVAAYNEKRGRVVALRELNNMSTRALADLGFDSRLIAQGVKGWPWRVEATDAMAEMSMVCDSSSDFQAQFDKCEAKRKSEVACNSEQTFHEKALDRVA